MSFTIGRLAPEHAADYRALMLHAYDAHPDAFTTSTADREGLPPSWWQARLAHGEDTPELFFGALQGRRLLGSAGLSFERRQKARHKATLFGMVVVEDAQGQGIGQALVQAVLAEASVRPELLLVQLTVTAGNRPAEALYRRCGFLPFGTEPMAVRVGDGFVHKVHMWCDLRKYRASRVAR